MARRENAPDPISPAADRLVGCHARSHARLVSPTAPLDRRTSSCRHVGALVGLTCDHEGGHDARLVRRCAAVAILFLVLRIAVRGRAPGDVLGLRRPCRFSSARSRTAAPKRTPDVIYVPTPQEVVDAMLKLAKVTKDDVVYDLGCGDGRIVVTAARKYGARGVGIDIDPQRIREAQRERRRRRRRRPGEDHRGRSLHNADSARRRW